jgi:protein translocase SecG subunit
MISSLGLIALILLQERSSGLSGIFGGEGGGFYQTRRGMERWLFIATIVLGAVFVGSAIAHFII